MGCWQAADVWRALVAACLQPCRCLQLLSLPLQYVHLVTGTLYVADSVAMQIRVVACVVGDRASSGRRWKPLRVQVSYCLVRVFLALSPEQLMNRAE